jgi:hypothetical protein
MRFQKLNLKKQKNIQLAKNTLKMINREATVIVKNMLRLQMNFTFISKDFEAHVRLIVLR